MLHVARKGGVHCRPGRRRHPSGECVGLKEGAAGFTCCLTSPDHLNWGHADCKRTKVNGGGCSPSHRGWPQDSPIKEMINQLSARRWQAAQARLISSLALRYLSSPVPNKSRGNFLTSWTHNNVMVTPRLFKTDGSLTCLAVDGDPPLLRFHGAMIELLILNPGFPHRGCMIEGG